MLLPREQRRLQLPVRRLPQDGLLQLARVDARLARHRAQPDLLPAALSARGAAAGRDGGAGVGTWPAAASTAAAGEDHDGRRRETRRHGEGGKRNWSAIYFSLC